MRTMTKVLTVAATLVLALSLAAPASASCGTVASISTFVRPNPGVDNGTTWVFGPPFQEFGIYYYISPDTGYGALYVYSANAGNPAPPPVSADASVSFWRLGAGNPALGLGTDNGSFDMIASGQFYVYGYASGPYFEGYWYAATIQSGWEPSGIDGCIDRNNCMCLLISDQDGDRGFWAITGGQSDTTFSTVINQGGSDGHGNNLPIILVPIPTPTVSNVSAMPFFGFGFSASVALSGGNFVQDGCLCETGGGFRIVAAAVPMGDPPPQSRDSAIWDHPVTLAGGAAQSSPSAFGSTVDFEIGCGAIDQDVYVAAELAFDSGFRTLYVSADAVGPGLPLSCPAGLVFPRFEPQAASLTFAEAKDGFTFSADYELDENSDGIFLRDEDVSVSFGTYTETIPAGSFVCTGFDCSYKSDGPGITSATVTDTLVSFRAEGIDLTDTKNPVDVEVVIGNDFGLAVVRLRGSLRFGDTDFVLSLSQGSRGGPSSAEP